MKKKTFVLTFTAAAALSTAFTGQVNAADRWGAGVGFNQYGRNSFGTIRCVGGYATQTAALNAAINGGKDNYTGGEWNTPGYYGVVGRGFNSNSTDVQIVFGSGYSTSAAATSAANASISATYGYNKLFQTAID